jgi:large subunit ribosomal protein L32e
MKKSEAKSNQKTRKHESDPKKSQGSKIQKVEENHIEKNSTQVKPRIKQKTRITKLKKMKEKTIPAKPENTVIEKPSENIIKQILDLRKRIRRGRPRFLRQESWRYVRVRKSWRKPKGIDSRMRREKKGWPKLVNIGYGSPEKSRGLHPSGYRDVLVNTLYDLETLNPELDAVRLATGLGARKRIEMLKRSEELGLKVLNPRGIRIIKPKD